MFLNFLLNDFLDVFISSFNYFYSHIFLCFFLTVHLIFVRHLKYKNDKKNFVLNNVSYLSKHRFFADSLKTSLHYDNTLSRRCVLYLKYYFTK